jgi:hypothetical protein
LLAAAVAVELVPQIAMAVVAVAAVAVRPRRLLSLFRRAPLCQSESVREELEVEFRALPLLRRLEQAVRSGQLRHWEEELDQTLTLLQALVLLEQQ